MSKKLTKTIILIVFVVFLGINKVEAAEPFMYCYYQNPSSSSQIVNVIIMDDEYQTVTASTSKELSSNQKISNPMANWTEATASSNYKNRVGTGSKGALGYGRTYFTNSDFQCPPNLYYVQFSIQNSIYFASGDPKSSLDILIKDATQDDRNSFDKRRNKERTPVEFKLVKQEPALPIDNNSENSNGNSTPQQVERKCECHLLTGNLNFNTGFTVSSRLKELEVTVDSNVYALNNSNADKILNWSSVPDELKSTTSAKDFTFLDYYLKKNSCPTHFVIGKSTVRNRYYLAGSETMAYEIQSAIQSEYSDMTGYVLSCKEAENGTSNNNSNSQSGSSSSGGVSSSSNASDQNAEITNNVGSLTDNNTTYSCGSGFVTGIPYKILSLTKIAYNFIQFFVPIVIIILGTLDLIKAITSQKEDEIKKGQSIFFKRLVTAVFVFFVFAIIKLIVSVVSDASKSGGIIGCMDCFLRGDGCVSEETSNKNEDN